MADEIMKKLNEHDEQLEVIARTVAGNQEGLDRLEQTTNKVVTKLVSVESRLERVEETMATKEDVGMIMNTLDTLVGLHRKTEQEQAFMGEQVKRNTEDIAKIKPLVGLEAAS